MNHKKWQPGTLMAEAYRDIANEHNALYDDWCNAMSKGDHIARQNSDLCDEIHKLNLELDEARKAIKQPIRVPFTDAQIDAMAKAGFETRMRQENGRLWQDAPPLTQQAWRSAIRAALAAGGLEPCAPPQYAPEDVALTSRVPELERELAAALAERDEIETKLMSETMKRQELEGYLADSAMAVIVAPAGVPSVYELARTAYEVRCSPGATYADKSHEDAWVKIATAIRDAVLAGMQPARPKGLPDLATIESAFYEQSYDGPAPVEFTLNYLAPYLREPVGWELDVTAGDIYTAWYSSADRSHEGRWQAVLDLCRSRIRPVFECQECAKLRDEVTFWKRENVASNEQVLAAIAVLQAPRAALEGE